MIVDNKISPFLTGPYIFLGVIFAVTSIGAFFSSMWIYAAVNFVIAFYLFATFSGVDIDTGKRKFRDYNKQFGLFKTGRWRSLNDYIGLTLVPMKTGFRMYSRSNRVNESTKNEYRIYLVNRAKKPSVTLKKCDSLEEGQRSLDELAIWLKLPVYSPR